MTSGGGRRNVFGPVNLEYSWTRENKQTKITSVYRWEYLQYDNSKRGDEKNSMLQIETKEFSIDFVNVTNLSIDPIALPERDKNSRTYMEGEPARRHNMSYALAGTCLAKSGCLFWNNNSQITRKYFSDNPDEKDPVKTSGVDGSFFLMISSNAANILQS